MLEKTYNAVVQYTLATTDEEIAEVFKLLSNAVASDLASELEIAGDTHRYDVHAKRAYYFERQGTNLAVWSWNEVHRPHEAGELIFRVVSSLNPLDEELANKCYVLATGRTVEKPWSALTNDIGPK